MTFRSPTHMSSAGSDGEELSVGVSAAIAGLGITEMGKVYGRTASDFAGEAIALALEDAGLEARDVDGLLINGNQSEEMAPRLQFALGLVDLMLVNTMSAFGSTAGTMLQYAAHAIETGQANVVACVYADAPLREGTSVSQSGYSGRRFDAPGLAGLRFAYGDYGPANSSYALALRRHMHLFGTTHDQLGTIAVGQREWALMNPQAQMRMPMTLEAYHASRWIVEPLHLFDCCLVSNGGVAVIVTSAQRARELRQPPVYLRGFGQCAPGDTARVEREPAIHTGAAKAGEIALRQARIELADVDVLELYDCYTYTVLVTLEDYGFCEKGEGGTFVEDGKLAPGGSLPCNTGGGQLSSYYMWGFTPLAEGVIQARGQGGERQVGKHDHVLVSGNGGTLNFHSTTILSKHDS
jgi:acetyl-CoA acetyltransferase